MLSRIGSCANQLATPALVVAVFLAAVRVRRSIGAYVLWVAMVLNLGLALLFDIVDPLGPGGHLVLRARRSRLDRHRIDGARRDGAHRAAPSTNERERGGLAMRGFGHLLAPFMTCVAWTTTAIYFAAGAVALVRLKATPAGLLIGGSLLVLAIVGAVARAVRSTVMSTDHLASMSAHAIDLTATNFQTASSCMDTVFTLCGVVGFFLLPKALERLAERRAA